MTQSSQFIKIISVDVPAFPFLSRITAYIFNGKTDHLRPEIHKTGNISPFISRDV